MSERKELVSKAIQAEEAQCYDDVVEFMKTVTAMEESLNAKERNLLSVGYKNKVEAKRGELRAICGMEKKEGTDCDENKIRLTKIADEMKAACQEFLDLIENHLIPKASDEEASVFAMKLQGDYFGYLAEVYEATLATDDVNAVVSKAREAYQEAMDMAKGLGYTNPIRLGLALNFSVFMYEILKDKGEACTLAKKSFDDAIIELDHLEEDSYEDITLLLHQLRENLTLWTAGTEEESEVLE